MPGRRAEGYGRSRNRKNIEKGGELHSSSKRGNRCGKKKVREMREGE